MRRRRRIQEDSRRLPSQPEQRPHFFKIIVKASLERGELVIPKDFTRQLVKKIADVAVLKVPSGRKWQVEVKEVDGSFRFQNGLQGFLKYHSISVGHFLVFRYDGNSNFSVFIFNQSACEIDYLSDIDDDLEESKLHSNCLIPVKKEPEEEDLMEVEPLNISTPSQPLPSSNVELDDIGSLMT
ncbi:B3 domain-containing transcription factor VRN1-like [Macadamia integrifolia]|uniref:B3 domain-containing transcription factor VRN1-like n=1 Tax=Macadamia integrifolia TaxID=60698 RepID=UPI001C4F0287|nr:B3 domain-containing transcription factor VRN1-like [Macadamia integrifolia]